MHGPEDGQALALDDRVSGLCFRQFARYIQTWMEHFVDFLKHDCTETCAAGVDLDEKLRMKIRNFQYRGSTNCFFNC